MLLFLCPEGAKYRSLGLRGTSNPEYAGSKDPVQPQRGPPTGLLASGGLAAETTNTAGNPNKRTMSTSSASLGYVILYVKDVSASLAFYEEAFGLSRRFFNDDNGKAYGELETGAARLAFASLELARMHLPEGVVRASPDKPPLGFEIALVTLDVPGMYARAVKAGALAVSEPAAKPWGQTVAYLRDKDGYLVELCTPLP
jgi:lactoylglutathione lyase